MKMRLMRLAVVLLVLSAVVGGMGVLILFKLGAREMRVASIEKIQGREGIPVEVVHPVRTDFVDRFSCDGNVVADVRAMLRAKVGEVVEAVHARVGEPVEQEQVLVEFRKTDLDEVVRAARAAYEEASNNHERHKALFEQEVISVDRFEQLRTEMENAAAALSSAESRAEFAQIRSPIEGVVEQRWVEPGEYKEVGKELMSVVDLDTVEVRALVPEQNVAALSTGTKGEIQLESARGWIAGTVSRMSPATTDPNRFFDVYLKVDNPRAEGGWLMRPGMYAEVRFIRGTVGDALAVPDNSVRFEGNAQAIYVVRREMAWVPVDTDPEGGVPEPQDSIGRRIRRGWIRLRTGLRRKVTGAEPPGPEMDTPYREVEVDRARRTRVVTGLRERQLVQLVGASLGESDVVIVNPRDAIRDGVLVAIAEGGDGE